MESQTLLRLLAAGAALNVLALVLTSNVASPDLQSQFAVGIGTGAGAIQSAVNSSPKNAAADTANKQCPDELKNFYDAKLKLGACPPETRTSMNASPQAAAARLAAACPRTNAYGLNCYYKQDMLAVQGICTKARWCEGKRYIDDKGNLCTFGDGGGSCKSGGAEGQKAYSETGKLIDDLSKPEQNYEEVIKVADDRFGDAFNAATGPQAPPVPGGIINQGQTGTGATGAGDVGPGAGASSGSGAGVGAGTGAAPPPAAGAPPSTGTVPSSAGTAPSGTAGGPGASSGSLPKPSLMRPDVFSRFVSAVQSGGGGGGGSSGGGGSGGSYAYVPVQNAPVYNNPSFDPDAPQSTFAHVGPTAQDSLSKLAQNDIAKAIQNASAGQRGPTAAEIAASMQGEAEQGVTQGALSRITTAVSEGAGNATSIFVNTVFGAIAELFGASPQPQREQGEEEADEFTQSLRDFELELVPGDPLTLDGTPRDEEGRPVSAQLDINPFGNAVAAAKEPSSESGGGGNWFSDLGAFLGVGGEEEPINVPGDPVAANEPQYAPSAEELAYLAEKDEAKEGGLIDSMLFTVKTTAKFFGGLLSSLFSGFASLFQFN